MELLTALVILILVLIILGIRIVPQASACVVERLGVYHKTMEPGINFMIPVIDRVVQTVTLKEVVADFPPQPVITKDNVTMKIDTVVYFKIFDPKLYTYGVESPVTALEKLSATTLRNIIGEKELDETLTARDEINTRMRATLDTATDPWGIKVERVEVQNIVPPADIQEAMEKQMRAERERREKILRAEGDKKSAILTAEGKKEAMILEATAKKEAMIAEAEGKARSMEVVYQAQARSIELINQARPSAEYLHLEGLKTYTKMADGKATKIVVPTELQSMATSLTNIKEMLTKE